MAEAFINLTEGSGKKAHAWDRTIGANTVLDEFTLPGEYPLASYSVTAAAVATLAANDHILQIMAGSSLNVRVRNMLVMQDAAASGVASWRIQVFRLTTAGSTGTAVTPRPLDSADSASGATALIKPSSKGTEGVLLMETPVWAGTAAIPIVIRQFDWEQDDNTKPIIIPAGTSNGIALKCPAATPTNATWTVYIEIVETSFV